MTLEIFSDILTILKTSFIASVIIYIISDTSAVREYLGILTNLTKRKLKVFEYNELYDHPGSGFTFQDKIISTYDNFFVRLIFCPICFSCWICSIINYNRIDLGFVSIYFSWIFYTFLVKYLKQP